MALDEYDSLCELCAHRVTIVTAAGRMEACVRERDQGIGEEGEELDAPRWECGSFDPYDKDDEDAVEAWKELEWQSLTS